MFKIVRTSLEGFQLYVIHLRNFFQIALVLMAIAMVSANPEPKADPKPKADPAVLAYSAPLVSGYVPSAAVYERTYHGNFAYPYAAAPLVAAAPYTAAYTAPVYFR